MKTTSFFESVLFAFTLSFISSVLLLTLSSFFPSNSLVRVLISAISLVYIIYLLTKSNERFGRLIVISIFLVSISIVWIIWPSISFFIISHMMIIWLLRCIYFYSSLVSSLVDLALNGASLIIAFVVAAHTNSMFLTLWCFLLMQALFVFIPKRIGKPISTASTATHSEADFQQSFRAAQAAVQQLSIK